MGLFPLTQRQTRGRSGNASARPRAAIPTDPKWTSCSKVGIQEADLLWFSPFPMFLEGVRSALFSLHPSPSQRSTDMELAGWMSDGVRKAFPTVAIVERCFVVLYSHTCGKGAAGPV